MVRIRAVSAGTRRPAAATAAKLDCNSNTLMRRGSSNDASNRGDKLPALSRGTKAILVAGLLATLAILTLLMVSNSAGSSYSDWALVKEVFLQPDALKALQSQEPVTATSRNRGSLRSLDINSNSQKHLKRSNYDICIVGAGLSGAIIAERYAATKKAQHVLVVEKRNHIGGNCYDYIDDETNIRVNKYGAHLFHTIHAKVWKYISRFGKDWVKYEHEVLAVLSNDTKKLHFPVPVNINTVNLLFGLNITSQAQMQEWLQQEQVHYDHAPRNSEEMAKSRVGNRLYELIFRPYTIKQWNKEPRDLGPEVTARIPVRDNWDGRYFGDPIQFLPKYGYTAVFQDMLQPHIDSGVIEMHLEMDYFDIQPSIHCQQTYFTGPIDKYFEHKGMPKLEYRSLQFERRVVKNLGRNQYYQPAFVVNHPSADVDFTRIVEYKHLETLIPEHEKAEARRSEHSVLFLERSSDVGEPYYPVPNDENKALYQKYQQMALAEKHVYFVGRLANYKYFNMDQAILNALELFEQHNPDVAAVKVEK